MDLIIKLSGEITESNFAAYKDEILAKIDNVKKDLKTDEDFATAEQVVKDCKAARAAIIEAEQAALNNTSDIRDLFQAVKEIKDKLQSTETYLTKQIKTRKAQIKDDIINNGMAKLTAKISKSEGHRVAKRNFIVIREDFVKAVKGKKKFETMEAAVDSLINRKLEEFQALDVSVKKNEKIASEAASNYPALFPDLDNLLMMTPDAIEGIVNSRVAQHKAEEKARLAEEKKKEEEKAELETEPEPEPEPVKQSRLFQPINNPGPEVGQGPDYSQPRGEIDPELQGKNVAPIVKHPLGENLDAASQENNYVMTVIFRCSREKAIEIAETVNFALEDYEKEVVSINLDKKMPVNA